jgi:hypothetical protein
MHARQVVHMYFLPIVESIRGHLVRQFEYLTVDQYRVLPALRHNDGRGHNCAPNAHVQRVECIVDRDCAAVNERIDNVGSDELESEYRGVRAQFLRPDPDAPAPPPLSRVV